MIEVNLQKIPAQKINVTLNGQNITLRIVQNRYNDDVLMDLSINDEVIKQGMICRNATKIIRFQYLGFLGDLMFIDKQGIAEPNYQEFGARFSLLYLFPEEL